VGEPSRRELGLVHDWRPNMTFASAILCYVTEFRRFVLDLNIPSHSYVSISSLWAHASCSGFCLCAGRFRPRSRHTVSDALGVSSAAFSISAPVLPSVATVVTLFCSRFLHHQQTVTCCILEWSFALYYLSLCYSAGHGTSPFTRLGPIFGGTLLFIGSCAPLQMHLSAWQGKTMCLEHQGRLG